jgi:hypothetical protein
MTNLPDPDDPFAERESSHVEREPSQDLLNNLLPAT